MNRAIRLSLLPLVLAACELGRVESPPTPIDTADALSGPHWVQNQTALSSGNGTTLRATLPHAVGAGDLLVGVFRAGGTLTVSDDVNGPWTKIDSYSVVSLFYVADSKPAPAGGLSVTLDGSFPDLLRISVDEFAGVAASGALLAQSVNGAVSGKSWSAGATTAVPAGQLVYGGASTGTVESFTAGTTGGIPMKLGGQAASGLGSIFSEYALPSVAGPQEATATFSAPLVKGINGAQAVFKTTATDAGTPPAPCTSGDPERVFWNDFEDGRYYADAGQTYNPSRDYLVSDSTRFAVVDNRVMADTHGGKRVLRGNFWEWNIPADGGAWTPQYDPPALAAGVRIRGSKHVPFMNDFVPLGILQSPSPDPAASTTPPGEVYISFWLWYDEHFSHDSNTGPQLIKLFYAFGPSHIEWVQTDEGRLAMNINNLGAWPLYPWLSPPHPFEGRWSHIEWYAKSESRPVFYEYGQFSNGKYLTSQCNPRPPDWTVQFPVPGSNPMRCTDEASAYAMNSKDGRYVMKVDGITTRDYSTMAWNGRFDQITFPAFHGGGGQPIASAGWAIDDVCIRKTAPPGF